MTPLEIQLERALRKAKAELLGLPHSLGYEFTHIPEIDAALQEFIRQLALEQPKAPY